jgi:uncharacterized repeat protein (TIGR03803 family)
MAAGRTAEAQTFTVLHAFTGGEDGAEPVAGLTPDGTGIFYGTTYGSGMDNQGTVFQLKQTGGNWVLQTLASGLDYPEGRVVFGPHGYLYGMTSGGQCFSGYFYCGGVYSLRPACSNPNCPWLVSSLYQFHGSDDGGNPGIGPPVFDQAGNLYGTTFDGGTTGNGVVFTLTPPLDGGPGEWTESPIYSFTDGSDGKWPSGGVIFDSAGNLYGATQHGGAYDDGTVFKLSPSGSGWAITTLYTFQGGTDGQLPIGGLILDGFGNLYGTTAGAGAAGGGTVFKLSPSGIGWTFSVLYGLPGAPNQGPFASLTIDTAGNLYGTTAGEGTYGSGSVFKLMPDNGGWSYTDLFNFNFRDGVVNLTGYHPSKRRRPGRQRQPVRHSELRRTNGHNLLSGMWSRLGDHTVATCPRRRAGMAVDKSPLQCAGLNRYEAGEEESLRERSSDPLGPEFCVGYREVHGEA